MIYYSKNNKTTPRFNFGGKGKQLISLIQKGYHVPAFCALSVEYLKERLNAVKGKNSNDLLRAIDAVHFPKKDIDNILEYFGDKNVRLAIRSSAAMEDGEKHSFAGLFESHLNISGETLIPHLKAVWKSAFAPRVLVYCQAQGISFQSDFSIIIQQMVQPEVSGVAFGINPINGRREELLISSVYGYGEGLVSGTLDADHFTIRQDLIMEKKIACKTKMLVADHPSGGCKQEKVPEDMQHQASLNEEQIKEIAARTRALNEQFGQPQDIEFAIAKGELYLLQSRPVTALDAAQSGLKMVWDNSNIVESYPGVTTPLTYSFIRRMYEIVYRQFSRMLGLPQSTIEENSDIFRNMLGLVRGRVYYNLRNWYKALALLPGYQLNAPMMEKMMGVKECFELPETEKPSRSKALWQVLKSLLKMCMAFRSLPRERRKFQAFIDKVILQYKRIDFDKCSLEEIWNHYQKFEDILTKKWNAPLSNDFFAMIFYGLLQKSIQKLQPALSQNAHNDLLIGSHDIISTQPMIQSLRIAKMIREEERLILLFEKEDKKVWQQLQRSGGKVYEAICAYLDHYGERCLGELKLESISYAQEPHRYIALLKTYIHSDLAMDKLGKNEGHALRKEAEAKLHNALKGQWLKKQWIRYLLKKSRDLVSNRENLRFERTRGFGMVRKMFLAMGRQLHKRGILPDERDIFYLSKSEIEAFIFGNSVDIDLEGLTQFRKQHFEQYRREAAPPERIECYGQLYADLPFEAEKTRELNKKSILRGIPCCQGQIRAKICRIESPDEVDDLRGRILVTRSTDPGWVCLFPTASAILVEKGSLLSHTAIVARELGIPCIVSVDGLMDQLEDDAEVFMDGSTGIIKVLEIEKNEVETSGKSQF